MKKIGILTFHCADNFGAVLQVYALQEKLKDLNINAEIIDFRPDELIIPYDYRMHWRKHINKIGLLRSIKVAICLFLEKNFIKGTKDLFKSFRDRYLNVATVKYYKNQDLIDNPPQYESYIVGSDQVWNPYFKSVIGDSYFLDFASKDSNKISYAASITQDIDHELIDEYRDKIQEFDYISIRESTHLELLNEIIDKEVVVTLDPTLLLEKEKWTSISVKPNIKEKYILVYNLENNPEAIKIANRISTEKGYRVVTYYKKRFLDKNKKEFRYEGPAEFLGYFENAEFVVTTSFHGTAFSVIFNKPFYTIPHTTRGDRMIDLLTSIKLDDRIIYTENELEEVDYHINYTVPNQLLNNRRQESIEFLKRALDVNND